MKFFNPENKFSVNFTNLKTKLCLSFDHSGGENYLSIKYRFVNLGVLIIYLLTIFVKEAYVKILKNVK